MKYSSHIGAVVVENVRIYHDLGYIFVMPTCNIKFWNAYGREQNQLVHLQRLTNAYKCLQLFLQ